MSFRAKRGISFSKARFFGLAALGLRMTFALFVFVLLAPFQARAESIRFWTALPEPDHAEMVELIDRYNQQNPSAAVDYTNFSSRPELFKALENQSDLPNLALIDSSWIEDLKSKLFPAENVLDKAGAMVKTVAKADTFRGVWESCVVDGKAYAIPFSAETAALVINPQYFKKIPKMTTFSQWQKAATDVKKNPVNISPIALPSSWEKAELGKLWTFFAIANSRSPFWKRKTYEHPLTLTDEIAALNLWWNWVNRLQIMSVPGAFGADNFIRAAMWILTPRDVESLHADKVVELLPKLRRPWSFLRVDALGFFDEGKAWGFAEYLTDYPQIKQWSMKTPTVPANKQVYLSPDFLQDMDHRRPWMRVFITAVDQRPRNLELSENRMIEVGDDVLKTLNKELKVTDAASEIHVRLFGLVQQKAP